MSTFFNMTEAPKPTSCHYMHNHCPVVDYTVQICVHELFVLFLADCQTDNEKFGDRTSLRSESRKSAGSRKSESESRKSAGS